MRPMSWPCGRRAQTQSPTAARDSALPASPPLVSRAENSARKTASSQSTAGKPRSRRTTHPMTSSSFSAPAATARSRAAPKAER